MQSMRAAGRRSCTPIAVLIAAGVAGCGGDSGASTWTGTMTDSAGVIIVSNGAEGLWPADDGWGVVELLRIGSMEGDPAYQFGQIAGIGITSDGRMFVLDQQAQHVKVFGADGVHLATLGAAGSGPGEFALGAGPVLVGAGDTVHVPDLQNQRVNRFAPDGSSAGSYPLNLQDGLPANWADTPSGTIVTQVRPLTFPGQEALENPMDAIIKRAPDGSPVDTLFKMRSGETVDFSGGLPEFHFFVPEPTWALLGDDGLLFAVNDQYHIEQYDGSGVLRRVILKPFEREAVTEKDQEIFVNALERIWRDSGVPPQAVEQLKARVNFAELFPAFFRFLAGPEGSMWVQDVVSPSRMSPEEQEGFNPLLSLGSVDWEVFDPEGRFLGSVSMPPRFQPTRFLGDRVYGVWRDDLDVQHVMVLGVTGIEPETATEMAPSGGE
jgi:hypothetical protein